jgi:hypothetical protein
MTKTGRRKSERSTRVKLSSPGRPPIWQRENLCWFWRGVAAGHSSEVSAVEAGVSGPVGIRWFQSSGGMPPSHLAPSAMSLTSRKLTFSEREEIALECAKGTGVRAIARKLSRSPGTISRQIRRNCATRGGDFDYRAPVVDLSARRPPVWLHRTTCHAGPRLARPWQRTSQPASDRLAGHHASRRLWRLQRSLLPPRSQAKAGGECAMLGTCSGSSSNWPISPASSTA